MSLMFLLLQALWCLKSACPQNTKSEQDNMQLFPSCSWQPIGQRSQSLELPKKVSMMHFIRQTDGSSTILYNFSDLATVTMFWKQNLTKSFWSKEGDNEDSQRTFISLFMLWSVKFSCESWCNVLYYFLSKVKASKNSFSLEIHFKIFSGFGVATMP